MIQRPDRRPTSNDKSSAKLPRIHLLGTGNIGKLIAHSIRSLEEPPPVTLLLHRLKAIKEWQRSRHEIRVVTGENSDVKTGFDWEPAIPKRRLHGVELDYQSEFEAKARKSAVKDGKDTPLDEDDQSVLRRQEEERGPIQHLIVTVKAPNTISALSTVRHRLTPDSTILFLQNGMGIVEKVNKEIFPDPNSRPNYMLGIISHGVRSRPGYMWDCVHTGFGTVSLGILPRKESGPFDQSSIDLPQTSEYILKVLTRIPVLAAVALSPTELFKAQLEKLAINAVINPMTSLLDARNGAILYNFYLTRVMRLLLAEISLVLRSLPELEGIPNIENRFSPERLETLVIGVAGKTSQNISSMLSDTRRGEITEIEYINGYIVKRGEEMGIKCVMNYLVMELVRGKSMLVDQEFRGFIPLILKETNNGSKL